MKHLTPPIPFTDYILDPATDNSNLWKRSMPKGLRDSEKRAWMQEEASLIEGMAVQALNKYEETGLIYFKSFAELVQGEADSLRRASKRKHIDRQP
jgi:hypothetical protein